MLGRRRRRVVGGRRGGRSWVLLRGLGVACRGAASDGAWSKSWTALRTSSSTRSALMAMAAADPSPAAVMTWARGLATLPATQTPGTLVRPVASVTTSPSRRARSRGRPAGRCSARSAAARTARRAGRRGRRPARHRSGGRPRRRAGHGALDDADGPGDQLRRARRRSACRRGEEDDVVGSTAGRSGRSGPRPGVPPRTPSGWSRTS